MKNSPEVWVLSVTNVWFSNCLLGTLGICVYHSYSYIYMLLYTLAFRQLRQSKHLKVFNQPLAIVILMTSTGSTLEKSTVFMFHLYDTAAHNCQ